MMKKQLLLCALLTSFLVFGCDGTTLHGLKNIKSDLTGHQETTNERLATAAKQAVEDGNPNEALQFYERLYSRNSRDANTALNYAQVLRKTGNSQRALMVLAPFADKIDVNAKKTNPDPVLLMEYATAKIEVGRFDEAEKHLQDMFKIKGGEDYFPQVRNLIGVSLDARGEHKAAETYYRDAIDTWVGQPVTVMNNLALNLAHQGYFDESLTLLRQARVIDPNRGEIAQNIDLVTALQSAVIAKPTALN